MKDTILSVKARKIIISKYCYCLNTSRGKGKENEKRKKVSASVQQQSDKQSSLGDSITSIDETIKQLLALYGTKIDTQ
jgi:hypothetical protein